MTKAIAQLQETQVFQSTYSDKLGLGCLQNSAVKEILC